MYGHKVFLLFLVLTFVINISCATVFAADGSESETEFIIDEETYETTTELITETITQGIDDTETTTETITETTTDETTTHGEDDTEENTDDQTKMPESPSDSTTATTETTTATTATTETITATTETTTETTTATTTETTTTANRPSKGGGGVSGGGVFNTHFSDLAKNTTEPTTQADKKKADVKIAHRSFSVFLNSRIGYLDNKLIFINYSPYIQKSSNSMLVSVRSLQQALSKDINLTWDNKSKTATAVYGKNKVSISSGKEYMLVNGKKVPYKYGAKAEIKDSRIYLPFRALGEGLGFNVNWDNNRKMATYQWEYR